MTERLPRERIDRLLVLTDEGYDTDVDHPQREDEDRDAYIHRVYFSKYLAAEVRALREELEQHKKWAGDRNYCDSCGKSILNIVTANATIARVEALVAVTDEDSHALAERIRAVLRQTT